MSYQKPEQETVKYIWVNCPNCSRRMFRHVPPKKFDIEVPCHHCKAIYRVHSKGEGISFDTVREPRYNHVPREFKRED